ncbi:MAG: hypothetical protein LBL72_11250 [Candidatus Accumulibacter sp.]|nr:hypothetical protein [Accumulibacter sp.]
MIKKLSGYSIVAVTLIAALIAFQEMGFSSWLNALAVVLAIGAAVKYIDSLSVDGVGSLVASLTIFLPFLVIYAIGIESGVSPYSYFITHFKVVDFLEMILPTATALVLTAAIKRFRAAKREIR